MIDEGSLDAVGLTRRDGLPALLFRLENASGAGQRVEVADAILAWFAHHPGFQAGRSVLVELLSAAVARPWAGGARARGDEGGSEHAADAGCTVDRAMEAGG